jgi:hypothetical protein
MTTNTDHTTGKSRRRIWIIAGAITLAALAVGIAVGIPNDKNTMTLQEVDAAYSMQQVTVTLEVTRWVEEYGGFTGLLVEQDSLGVYHRTGRKLAVRVTASTEITTGALGDIKPGALVRVVGVMAGTHEDVSARELIILPRDVSMR